MSIIQEIPKYIKTYQYDRETVNFSFMKIGSVFTLNNKLFFSRSGKLRTRYLQALHSIIHKFEIADFINTRNPVPLIFYTKSMILIS